MEDDRPMYLPLRRPEDFQLTWPLLPGEEPPIKWARLPACAGHCQQGKRLCVTPDACRLPDDEESESEFGAFEAVVRYGPHMGLMWVVIGVIAAAIWAAWW